MNSFFNLFYKQMSEPFPDNYLHYCPNTGFYISEKLE